MMVAREMLIPSRLGQSEICPEIGETDSGIDGAAGPRRKTKGRLTDGDNGQFRPKKTDRGGHGTMDKITKMFVKVSEYQRGQTMAEYALILSAVAVVVFVGYQTMGTTITSLLSNVDGKL